MPPPPASAALVSRARGLPALIAAQVSLQSAATGLRVAGPLLLLQSGAPAWQVGLLIACFGVGPVLVAWPTGRLVDTRGYHPPMRAALAAGLASTVVGFAASFAGDARLGLLCLAAAIAGAASNASIIALQRTAARMARDAADLRSRFGWVGMAPPAANVIGPIAAGVALDLAGPHGALLALAAFPLIAALLVRAARAPAPPDATAPAPDATLAGLLGHATVRRMMLIDLLVIAAWDVHAFVVPVLGHDRGLSSTVIGSIYGLFAAGVVLVRGLIPWVADRITESRVLVASMLGTAAVFVVYPFGESAAFMAACALALGVTLGFAQPMILSAMHQAVPERQRGGMFALRTIWINLGAIGMPLGFAAAGAAVGWSTVLWALAAAIGGGSRAARRG
jgi:MFS family permease